MQKRLSKLPPQPSEDKWSFVEDIKKPLHGRVKWKTRSAASREVCLAQGLHLDIRFNDPADLLETAFHDFNNFLKLCGLNNRGPYPVIIQQKRVSVFEEYFICIKKDMCEIEANDTEGIRRALVWLEDEMLRRDGPFLPAGDVHRKPVVRTRISRCFYGPINRPPKNRDELADDINYYPEEYLNRLAHEGVNALWLTITFKDTCPSAIIPEYGKDSARRLAKLRLTVQRCARYGIKIYPFCIEPAAIALDSPILKAHPELKGHSSGGYAAFCTSTRTGLDYLEEAMRVLFSAVPGLGGMICIPVGERFTHCHSGAIAGASKWGSPNTCPRCSKRKPWEVLSDTLAAMERGMHSANPDAELVAWPYSQYSCWGEKLTVESAGHLPEKVILQHNYESSGRARQSGKWRIAHDYWLSYIGPSKLFMDCAKSTIRHGARMFAKLQVACSHEVASVPFIPVPGNLYKKYKTMHRLGVSGAMHSWYFGNYPSLMTKAAGELSFAPFPATEKDFLLAMAKRDWQKNAAQVVKAWSFFQKGYDNFPLTHIMGYYGPMHDGPVWPLYLEPKNLPLSPTWQINFPPSGDQIGECMGDFTYAEILELCGKMAACWRKGVAIMKSLLAQYRNNRDRVLDISVAVALGLQFQSGYNIFRFYTLREKLAESRGRNRLKLLADLMMIVEAELKIDKELLELTESDSRLGFHSEAEGYKYFPEKISWRMAQLKGLLQTEFPMLRRRILKDEGPLFPAYTGETPGANAYRCVLPSPRPALNYGTDNKIWSMAERVECPFWGNRLNDLLLTVDSTFQMNRRTQWQAIHDKKSIYFKVTCFDPKIKNVQLCPPGAGFYWLYDCVCLHIKPDRMGPPHLFIATPNGIMKHIQADRHFDDNSWKVSCRQEPENWSVIIKIPFATLGIKAGSPKKPIPFNIVRLSPLPADSGAFNSWIKPDPLPEYRLCLGTVNPAKDFGWLVF